ncbi:Aste57867_24145 [Aphanomyces stellatus]|uniref:Aste57867_24145 protein n=1 Tax=Aphanomyces stellatus TaxID=120398 RepID=A0A485KC66_9STRA|nr:hypothetical protein As57867_024071 [Aphanomyces stellatus]KAF0715282.1 hypothetical protein As57867_003440 [Aphanomyces stellatus]KAF0715300.1 hypothetical protein As57867_003458 [Aphanomyces stellatus]VFT80616.1 Aste57867_3450 [Aphanomyces stellatus]VFT80634.1 Aste57867_3468 [Aphanomyces stellatus]
MATATSILLSRDILRRVCQFQRGTCEDMRPFLTLPLLSTQIDDTPDYWEMRDSSPYHEIALVLDTIVPPWLAEYHMDRLGNLFDCLETVREPTLLWAALFGRLDVLVWVEGRYNLSACSGKLLVAGAGHLNVLSYLWSIGYRANVVDATKQSAILGASDCLTFLLTHIPPRWLDAHTIAAVSYQGHRQILELLAPQLVQNRTFLRLSIVAAAANSRLEIATWLHQILLGLHLNVEYYDSDVAEALWILSSTGRLDGLEWLLAVTVVAQVSHVEIESYCLGVAMRHQQDAVIQWLVTRIAPSSLVDTYLSGNDHCAVLDPFVDPTIPVAEKGLEYEALSWSTDKLRRVFEKFDDLSHAGPIRTDALKKCLYQVVSRGQLVSVPWIMSCLDRVVVNAVVVKALQLGMHQGGEPMLDFFHAQDMHLPAEIIDDELYSILRRASDKSVLPPWLDLLEDSLSKTDKVARWLVVERGGQVAVMGHLLARLAHGKKTILQFKTLFSVWRPLVNDEDRTQVFEKCLQRRKRSDYAALVDFLVLSDPYLFISLSTSRNLATVRRLHAIVAQTATMDTLRHVQSEALAQAAAAGRCGVVKFLVEKIGGQAKDVFRRTPGSSDGLRSNPALEIVGRAI